MALVDGHVSTQQCKLAVDALMAHATKHEERNSESQLLSGKEQNVWLVVNVKVMQPEKKFKPARIPVKHPIVDPRTTPVCLITKDPQREYKELLANLGIKFISRVVDIRHLKGKWKPYEARRMLLKENGLFLADDRVVPLLPGLLGKIFFSAKKQPIPVSITCKDVKAELERAISSTYFHQNQGTCTSVKIGTLSHKPAQVLANLETALPAVVKRVKGGWDNIQSLLIKTNFSAALPIWQCDLGADSGGRWEGLVANVTEDGDVDMDAEEGSGSEKDEGMASTKPTRDTKGRGKKRASEDVEAETEEPKPKKKAKGSDLAKKPTKAKVASTESAASDNAKAAAAQASVVPDSSSQPPSVPAKKMRRKSDAETPSTAPPPSVAMTDDKGASTAPGKGKRKRKHAQPSESVVEPTSAAAAAPPEPSDLPAAPPAKKEKRKKARTSVPAPSDATASPSSPAKAVELAKSSDAAPTHADSAVLSTPSAPKENKPRASAVDFFNEEAPVAATPALAAPANPPNTPADGLPEKRRKRAKGGAIKDTPVTSATAKLASEKPELKTAETTIEKEAAGEALETPSTKKLRRKQKSGAPVSEEASSAVPQASAPVVVTSAPVATTEGTDAPAEKKRKRKHKGKNQENPTESAAPALSAQELKQKRSGTSVEKKKEKVLGGKPATKSAKDEVVGKKPKKL